MIQISITLSAIPQRFFVPVFAVSVVCFVLFYGGCIWVITFNKAAVVSLHASGLDGCLRPHCNQGFKQFLEIPIWIPYGCAGGANVCFAKNGDGASNIQAIQLQSPQQKNATRILAKHDASSCAILVKHPISSQIPCCFILKSNRQRELAMWGGVGFREITRSVANQRCRCRIHQNPGFGLQQVPLYESLLSEQEDLCSTTHYSSSPT